MDDDASFKHDVFISHASEDKRDVAEPLAQLLTERGLSVWLDKYELKLGDELLTEIDRGLSESRYGVVILSLNFFRKRWPRQELNGLVGLEADRQKVILPVWHRVNERQVREYSPILASRLGASTDSGLQYVAGEICRVVQGRPLQVADEPPVLDPDVRDLQEIRSELLAGPSADALTTLDFRVDEVLERRPGHVEARVLKQQVQKAVRAELKLRRSPEGTAPPSLVNRRPRARGLFVAFSIVICGGLFTYYYLDQLASRPAMPPPINSENRPEAFARQWLSLLDKGDFEAAWAALNDSAKEQYPPDRFADDLKSRRAFVDPERRAGFGISGGPDGETRVHFHDGDRGSETVSLERRKDTWVVTWYRYGRWPRSLDGPFPPDRGASR